MPTAETARQFIPIDNRGVLFLIVNDLAIILANERHAALNFSFELPHRFSLVQDSFFQKEKASVNER